jgi:protein-S-isoprenylcysteine O-methyltransferase
MLNNHVIEVSAISLSLGVIIGGSIVISILRSELAPLAMFLVLVSTFHVSEFLNCASFHCCYPQDGFLLDNGWEYCTALVASIVEVVLRSSNFNRRISIIGVILSVVGLLFRVWSIRHCGRNFSHRLAASSSSQFLVTTGPYALVRHPSYSGFILFAVGLQLLLCNYVMGLITVLVLAKFFRSRVEYEEEALHRRFGETYSEYMIRVPFSGIL